MLCIAVVTFAAGYLVWFVKSFECSFCSCVGPVKALWFNPKVESHCSKVGRLVVQNSILLCVRMQDIYLKFLPIRLAVPCMTVAIHGCMIV